MFQSCFEHFLGGSHSTVKRRSVAGGAVAEPVAVQHQHDTVWEEGIPSGAVLADEGKGLGSDWHGCT